MPFNSNGIRTADKQFGDEDIIILRENWKDFVTRIPKYKKKLKGKGIVFTAGGVSYVTCAIVSITMLREKGCQLPIELWYLGNELSSEVIDIFEGLNVTCCDFRDVGSVNLSGYMLKPLAIINSSFEEVLFLDADNNCVSDPTNLFSSPGYQETGALFWPDYWKTSKKNPIWQIIETKTYDIPEQESGQLLINKRKCWKELQLCLHFNRLGAYYYQILHGDKDTFKFAWLALKRKFTMVEQPVGSCGYNRNGVFFGMTMVQHHPNGNIMFLHRNLLKWDITKDSEVAWETIKTFEKESKSRKIILFNSPEGHLSVNLTGDIIEENFRDSFGDYEAQCQDILKKWRCSDQYHRFLEYTHFAGNRYRSGIPFSLSI